MNGPVVTHAQRAANGAVAARRRASACVLLAAAFALAAVAPANAQTGGSAGNVNGTVSSINGEPVTYAVVALASPSGSFSRHTDGHGYFSFLAVPTETYTLSIEAPGYDTFVKTGIAVTGAATLAMGSLQLVPATRVIGTVTARSPASAFQPNQTIPQYTLSGSVLQAAAGKTANANESQILLAVPGFQNDVNGNLILQGATIDQIRYQLDGIDFTDPGISFSANNKFFNGISSVQVISGAGNPSQGNAGAGVVNLIVKRGTYPPGGTVDLELNDRPEGQQVNAEYGAASRDGRLSDYLSYFGENDAFQYGPWNSAPFAIANQPYLNQRQNSSDFVNNFVYRFGRDDSQSLQVLYLAHADAIYGNYAGLPLVYDNGDANVTGLLSAFSGVTPAQVSQLMSFELGQTAIGQPIPPVAGLSNASLLKLEYDRDFGTSTSLALRFFHSDVFDFNDATGNELGLGLISPPYGETTGGSRSGANFDLTQQVGERHTLTFSGNYEFSLPIAGYLESIQGFEALGANVIDFLRPPNADAPISAANPCPVAGGCYLQQYFFGQGGTPTVPNTTYNWTLPQLNFGAGLRDEYQVTNDLRLDLGLRYDLYDQFLSPSYLESLDENVQPVPGNPSAYYVQDFGFIDRPHYLQPRIGLSYLVTPHDTLALTYGKSINQGGNALYATAESAGFLSAYDAIPVNPNWQLGTSIFGDQVYFNGTGQLMCNINVPYPIGATATSNPSYDGTVAGPNPTLQMGRPCASYGDLLHSQLDAFSPDIETVQPAVLYNNDISYAHVFRNGLALKLDAFNRQAYHVPEITALLILNPLTQSYTEGISGWNANGTSETSGLSFNLTLPDRPNGFTGFLSATYTNELTNTFGGEDFEPFVLPQYFALGDEYRAGFVSPLTLHLGISYKTKTGWRINPILNVNDGFPYNWGSTVPYFLPGNVAVTVPDTNITNPYASGPYFVDPANPGSVFAPTISATRGNAEGAPLSQLSPPVATMDMTIEFTPPKAPRNTFGLQIIDVFDNGYYYPPGANPNFYPVTSGVSGPLTGQSLTGALTPGYASLIAADTYPFAPYNISPLSGSGVGIPGVPNTGLPTTFRVYYQLKI